MLVVLLECSGREVDVVVGCGSGVIGLPCLSVLGDMVVMGVVVASTGSPGLTGLAVVDGVVGRD